MRSILNISLPQKLKDEVELAVKQGGYATKSELIREALRLWKEDSLHKKLKKSQKAIIQGKGIKLNSLKDLR